MLKHIDNDPNLRDQRRTQPSQINPLQLPEELRKHLPKLPFYTIEDSLLFNLRPDGQALVIPNVTIGTTNLRERLISLYHDDPLSGHRSTANTLRRLQRYFYWHRMHKEVQAYVSTCGECARAKSKTTQPDGLINPVPIPGGPYQSISIDWIMTLEPCKGSGHDAILVVVDDFSKRVRLIPCYQSITGEGTAELLRQHWFLHYGFPINIRSDRDPRLTGTFWRDFTHYSGIKHSATSGGYAASNGLVERMNRVIEEIARCYVDFRQYQLWEVLGEIEFAINDSVNPETGVSPFEATLGTSPLRPIEISTGAYKNTTATSLVEHFDRLMALQSQVRHGLVEAQAKWVYEKNRHRRAIPLEQFQPGDLVYIDSRNFIPAADREVVAAKLRPKFYGPYPIISQITPTSFKVKLPPRSRVYPVFHTTRLKRFRPNELYPHRRGGRVDPEIRGGEELWEVQQILDKRKRRKQVQYLVRWRGFPISESTWEPAKWLKDEGCQESIDDYENRPHLPG